ncbi:hypothetical protein [Nocardioides solisilvae]|uniref:hypothetical protein n=1 Tax=Nocardioides solisilvae TaxID=1542435 RepID=UPI000D740D0F|nr:hypothetical protein [Nocardioides solisilvae]
MTGPQEPGPQEPDPRESGPQDAATRESGPQDAATRESDWERQRRLARVFGDVLPETTSDERDPEPGGLESSSDAWLRAQVPPHHGG